MPREMETIGRIAPKPNTATPSHPTPRIDRSTPASSADDPAQKAEEARKNSRVFEQATASALLLAGGSALNW